MERTRATSFDFDAVNRSLGERGIVPAAPEEVALVRSEQSTRRPAHRARNVAVAAVGLLAVGLAVKAARESRRGRRVLRKLPRLPRSVMISV